MFHETSFCFVGCHLAAHQSKIDLRNSNFREIVRGLQFHVLEGKVKHRFDLLNQFDHLFWMGDLNYRIEMPREQGSKTLLSPLSRTLDLFLSLQLSNSPTLQLSNSPTLQLPNTTSVRLALFLSGILLHSPCTYSELAISLW
jgi:Endonuclease/Exonuclease/phosphatase family 2